MNQDLTCLTPKESRNQTGKSDMPLLDTNLRRNSKLKENLTYSYRTKNTPTKIILPNNIPSSRDGQKQGLSVKPSFFTFKRPLTQSFQSQLVTRDTQGSMVANSNMQQQQVTGAEVAPGGNAVSQTMVNNQTQLNKLHHFTQYNQWQAFSKTPQDKLSKKKFTFQFGGLPVNARADLKNYAEVILEDPIQQQEQHIENQPQLQQELEQPVIDQVKTSINVLNRDYYQENLTTMKLTEQNPIQDVRVMMNKRLSNQQFQSRQNKISFLKPHLTVQKKQSIYSQKQEKTPANNLPMIADFQDLVISQKKMMRSNSQPFNGSVYGKLFITSTKKKHVEEYQKVVQSRDYYQYKILLLKNKIKVMDKYLSKLKPIVCLNSIRSIYKKQSENNEQLTRKRILIKYLQRLFDTKMSEHFGVTANGEKIINDEIKQEVVMALTEKILSGQLDSEDGSTERVLQDIIRKHDLEQQPKPLFE